MNGVRQALSDGVLLGGILSLRQVTNPARSRNWTLRHLRHAPFIYIYIYVCVCDDARAYAHKQERGCANKQARERGECMCACLFAHVSIGRG